MGNALNLQEIDQEQALHLSKFFIRSSQNLFLFGRRGVGKTQIAIQAAESCKLKVNYINLSVIERPDLAGYPDMQATGDIVTFKSPAFLPTLEEKTKPNSILLFDEVDKAPPEVTAPLLEILQFRRINGKPLNVAGCILTANLLNEGAYSNLISTALLDRGAKYILSFNFEKWVTWAKAYGVHDLILGFLSTNPDLACGKVEETTYASPSPRAWTLASDALIKARDLKMVDIETVTQIISGFVGGEAGLKFKIWYEHYRKFEPSALNLLESGMMSLNYNELAPTEQIVFVVSVCHLAKHKLLSENPKTKNKMVYLEHLCNFLKQSKVSYEIQTVGLGIFHGELITKYKLYDHKAFFEHLGMLENVWTLKK